MKKQLLTIFITAFCFFFQPNSILAQPFGDAVILDKNEYFIARDLSSADFNNDGIDDVAYVTKSNVVGFDDEILGVFISNSLGDFDDLILSTTENGPENVLTIDIDSDNDIDIAASMEDHNRLVYYENDGNGAFSAPKVIADNLENAILSIAGDIDGDDDIDFITTTGKRDTLTILKNNNGSYDVLHTIVVEYIPNNMLFEDVDEDGDMDLVIATSNFAKVHWFENNGSGTFSSGRLIVHNDRGGPNAIAFADINNDNHRDLVVAFTYDSTLVWFQNDGEGNFSNSNSIGYGCRFYRMACVDFDLDADIDIVVSCDASRELFYFNNIGNSNFEKKELPVFQVNDGEDLLAGNFNGDNLPDVLVSSSIDQKIGWYPNIGNGNFGREMELTDNFIGTWDFDVGDINNDGNADLFTASFYDNRLAMYQNRGNGIFSGRESIRSDYQFIRDIELFDIDEDGDLDVVSLYQEDNKVVAFKNDGKGNFEEEVFKDSVLAVEGLSFQDIDGDGKKDMVLRSNAAGWFYYYKNLGEGTFANGVIIDLEIFSPLVGVLSGDIDDDGDIDILGYKDTPGFLYWYNNDGGNYSQNQIDPTFSPYIAKLGDIDDDGDLDIVAIDNIGIIGFTSCIIAIYINDGTGKFLKKSLNYDQPIREFTLVDFEEDGKLEVIGAAYDFFEGVQKLASFEYVNDQLIESFVISDQYGSFGSLYYEDIDNDGDRDIIGSGNELVWIKNLKNSPSLSGQVFFDADNDGKFDNNERGIGQAKVTVTPLALSSYTTPSGYFKFVIDQNNYNISAEIDSNWIQTTQPTTYNILSTDSTFIDTLLFGFSPLNQINDLDIFVTANARTRCRTDVPFSIAYSNSGTSVLSGYITVSNEHLIERIDTSISTIPDSVSGDQLFWKFEDLYPGEGGAISLFYTIADQNFVGDTIVLEAKAIIPVLNNNADQYPVSSNFEGPNKVTICHCTSSSNNPYVVIKVPQSAIDGYGDNDHSLHDCDIIPITDRNNDGKIDKEDCLVEKPTYDNICFTGIFESVVRCSYDPNDKLANPVGEGEEQLTLKDQSIIYTIRFQNTGNDTAYHVAITDSLDSNLDVNTFKFLSASHKSIQVERQIYNQGQGNEYNELQFIFDPILLPDSITDETGSQGFVMFSISPKAGAEENTVLKNKASIVFDRFTEFPIITNTVEHTLVSQLRLPTAIIDRTFTVGIMATPNPFNNQLKVALERPVNMVQSIDLSIVSINGRKLIVIPNTLNNEVIFNTSNLSTGTYWIVAEDGQTKEIVGLRKVIKH